MNEKYIIKAESMYDYFKEETLLLRYENKQLQEIIDKAIKVLEDNDHEYGGAIYDALNILKGEKKNG